MRPPITLNPVIVSLAFSGVEKSNFIRCDLNYDLTCKDLKFYYQK